MSGHSHWSTIRRKKEANDAKKGAVFTKVAREIVIAAREGGGDPDSNMRLRMVLDKARSMGMPKDNIERAVKRGAGDEGYGPNGVAILIDVMTDNRNRTIAALRHALTRQGGSMGDPGSVAWQFERRGVIGVPANVDFDKLFEIAVEAGAADVAMGDGEDNHEVYTDPTDLHTVSKQIKEAGLSVVSIDLIMAPKNEMSLPVKDAVQILKLVDNLEEMDDVRRVFSNLEVTEEAVEAFESAF
ncbi:MAG: putative transcriptional regulatory protein [Chloroflexi bacterium ADurb.Bin360]|nr:MAG: putative transcriptional regulatory protein [Chloroflexi bacterium ADurb.Bin360]